MFTPFFWVGVGLPRAAIVFLHVAVALARTSAVRRYEKSRFCFSFFFLIMVFARVATARARTSGAWDASCMALRCCLLSCLAVTVTSSW